MPAFYQHTPASTVDNLTAATPVRRVSTGPDSRCLPTDASLQVERYSVAEILKWLPLLDSLAAELSLVLVFRPPAFHHADPIRFVGRAPVHG